MPHFLPMLRFRLKRITRPQVLVPAKLRWNWKTDEGVPQTLFGRVQKIISSFLVIFTCSCGMSVCEKPPAATLLIFFDSTTKTDAPIGLGYSRLRFVMVVLSCKYGLRMFPVLFVSRPQCPVVLANPFVIFRLQVREISGIHILKVFRRQCRILS